MDPSERLKGSNAHNQPKENVNNPHAKDGWKKMGCEDKKAAVHEEMKRMHKLPANSTYATHRLRVLNKILQLLTIQRTISQEEELELLFASLSI
ncbi:Translation initiation factor IF-2 like [Actinidia chinensis var. chinensis]|uniref:Translation initiation factor IF-2 like n=1 Tax=Actinidia chinensis var. chinensis TaxID=1590841 RepID=A0A2R6PUC8_ACTCC|nr:Translation initiation factor IF-2 like [Actinidia chinensis var. chinensis]